jgi:predicted phosphodiesterase
MMYAIFSDIHANMEAFEAVIQDMKRQKVDKNVFLGDIVGYGPNPNECIELLRENCDVIIRGNHDSAVIGNTNTAFFNSYARESVIWTAKVLSKENVAFLKNLKSWSVLEDFQIAHSTPFKPDSWNYLTSLQDAHENYQTLERQVCFIGHSHQPLIIEFVDEVNVLPIKDLYKTLNKNRKYIINAGSVGQPRDMNPEACYLTFDTKTDTIEYRRVEYNIEKVQKKMKKHELPPYLIDRLSIGR